VGDRFAVELGREVVSAAGPEAGSYLQGQLSQDVVALVEGGFAWSWLLAPNGKVDALVRVTRVSGEEWWLDTDGGWGEAVLARLARFKLRTKLDLALVPMSVVGLRGPGWDLAAAPGRVLSPPWPGVEGADLLVSEPPALGADLRSPDQYEAERIAAGIPRMGAELDERTIPGESGLVPLTVSFTKGCYTGQELVARIDSRGGNVAKHLRGLRLSPGAAGPVAEVIEAGTALVGPDGAPAGTVTSAAYRIDGEGADGEWVGLGYVKRGIDPAAVLSTGAGRVRLRQVELTH
jgi:folate-binding protein YgfZ